MNGAPIVLPILPKSPPIFLKVAQFCPKAPPICLKFAEFCPKAPNLFQLCPQSPQFFSRLLKSIKNEAGKAKKWNLNFAQFCQMLLNFVQFCEKVEKMKKYKRKRGPTQRAHFTSKHVPLTLW